MEDELKKIKSRKGWAETFKKIHKAGDDKLLIPAVFKKNDNEGILKVESAF